MKVYTVVDEDASRASFVGTVLVNDNDEILFKKGIKLTIQDKVSAHCYGLKSCLSYCKSNSITCENIQHNLYDNVRVDIDKELRDRVAADQYINRFFPDTNILINNKQFEEKDKTMFAISRNLISYNNKKSMAYSR